MKKARHFLAVFICFSFVGTDILIFGQVGLKPAAAGFDHEGETAREWAVGMTAEEIKKAGQIEERRDEDRRVDAKKTDAFSPVALAGKSKAESEIRTKKFPWLLVGGIAIVGAVAAVLLLKKKRLSRNPAAPTGKILVESTPKGAEIYLDGINTGRTTDDTIPDVATGNHIVKLVLKGYGDYEWFVVVLAGQTSTVLATLTPIEIEMIRLPGGTFLMGSESSEADPDEKPVHQVTVSSFEIGKYEVTQGEWELVMKSNLSHFRGSRLPVEQVKWDEVQVFIQRLNAATGNSYRLPTEAEWEYACRAGSTGDRYGSLDSIAWYFDNSGSQTHEVGGKTPNGFGLHDMLGNVAEWCSDWYGPYSADAAIDPQGPSSGSYKIYRGGSWFANSRNARASRRISSFGSDSQNFIGFRLARD